MKTAKVLAVITVSLIITILILFSISTMFDKADDVLTKIGLICAGITGVVGTVIITCSILDRWWDDHK